MWKTVLAACGRGPGQSVLNIGWYVSAICRSPALNFILPFYVGRHTTAL